MLSPTHAFSNAYFPLSDFFGHVMHFWTSTWVDLIDAYGNPQATFSSNVAYWHIFDSMCLKQ
jgi:hypothetical protein